MQMSVCLSVCRSSFTISGAESGQGHLWDYIETWGFREDIKDVKGIGMMMMTTMKRRTTRWRTMIRTMTTTRMITMTRVSQFRD